MEIYCINQDCAAFGAAKDEVIGKKEAEELIKRMLREKKFEPWKRIDIDVFAADGKRLFLAHPGTDIKISLAPYALPFITEYFTE